jgi:hypothetical protein
MLLKCKKSNTDNESSVINNIDPARLHIFSISKPLLDYYNAKNKGN